MEEEISFEEWAFGPDYHRLRSFQLIESWNELHKDDAFGSTDGYLNGNVLMAMREIYNSRDKKRYIFNFDLLQELVSFGRENTDMPEQSVVEYFLNAWNPEECD